MTQKKVRGNSRGSGAVTFSELMNWINGEYIYLSDDDDRVTYFHGVVDSFVGVVDILDAIRAEQCAFKFWSNFAKFLHISIFCKAGHNKKYYTWITLLKYMFYYIFKYLSYLTSIFWNLLNSLKPSSKLGLEVSFSFLFQNVKSGFPLIDYLLKC